MSTSRRPPPFAPSGLVPEAIELNGDTAWDLWDGAVDALNERFADTAPSSMPMRLAGGDPRYAATMPSPLHRPAARPLPATGGPAQEPTLEDALLEARRANRVCPQPHRWLDLYDILQRAAAGKPLTLPAPPLTGKAWLATPPLAKRMCFREQLEWAASHRCIGPVYALLKSLPDADWHYMGD